MSAIVRLSIILGDQGWYWLGTVHGSAAYQRWGRWGSKGSSHTEPCASPEAAHARVDAWVIERRRLGYQDDPTNDGGALIDHIMLGPSTKLPAGSFAPPTPQRVEIRGGRIIVTVTVHTSITEVIVCAVAESHAVIELGRIELRWLDDRVPGLAVHGDEVYIGDGRMGYPVLNIDGAYAFAIDPPPLYPPSLQPARDR
ncbi:MAG: WGR domain-containing protein [Kofleriaceae bacterium]